MSVLLDVAGLRVAFGEREVVHGIDLRVAAGECLALVGESGSGKSATARALVGLAGDGATVSADRLEVAGTAANRLDESGWRSLRGRRVGLVLQDALTALDPLRRVGAEVAEPLHAHGRRRPSWGDRDDARRRRVEALLESVGIPDAAARMHQHPHELSGGLRQRALIATALAGDPPLVIADEPTTALDVTVQRQVLRLLTSLKADGRGLLLVSHDLAVVADVADRIAVMHDGDVVETAPTAQLVGAPRHEVTRALLDAIPRGRRGSRASADPDGPPLVAVTAVTKRYRQRGGDDRTALAGIDLQLRAGETLGVAGESGSGKSTLARIVLGLLAPDEGEVRLGGDPWSALPERRRRGARRTLQHVPQDARGSLDPRTPVRGALLEALGARRLAGRSRDAELSTRLAEVGLAPEHLDRRPRELSGGQAQRVAIARALATDPAVLVCDEPVSALDVRTQAQILGLLDRVQRDRGLAILLISHDLAVLREVCDRMVVLKDGAIVEAAATDAVFERPRHPYTRALLAAVPRLERLTPTEVAA